MFHVKIFKMKRTFLTFIAAALICAAPSLAQTTNIVEKAKYFLAVEEMPDASRFLPDPPGFGDDAFLLDSCVYEAGKRLRDTDRGRLAVEDANTSIEYILRRFSPALGAELTTEEFPLLASFIYRTCATARLSITYAKDKFHRMRPYQYFDEPTPVPGDESKDDFTSYPSGHTIRFWTAALALTAIDPEHQDEILRIGYECGQSRTIVGFHYQSDIEAARHAASAAYARLSADRQWLKTLKKARREFQRKKAGR